MRVHLEPPTAARRAGEGEAYWWTGELATIKVAAEQTGGRLGLVEILAPEGLRIPRHVHFREDEGFWILEGTVTFELPGQRITATAGDFVFGPRGVPHAYSVDVGPARMLFVFTPGGFEGFIRETGEPAPVSTLPPPHVVPDMERVAAIAPKYGCELIG